MKVCLINPPRLLRLVGATMKPAPPLGLSFIAGAISARGHEVTVIDTLAEGRDDYYPFKHKIMVNGLSFEDTCRMIPHDVDIIGFSIMFSGNWIHNREMIDEVASRFPSATIIAGGEHITACPEFCLEQTVHLKACIIGEGEETVVELLDAIMSGDDLNNVSGISYKTDEGKIITTERRPRVKELLSINRPAWEFFPLKKYVDNQITLGVAQGILSLPLLATRGCPYTCTFCSSPLMWGTKYNMRSVKDVADEIETFYHRYNARNFDFYDLTAIIKKQWIIDFCQELLKRDLPNLTWQIPAGTRSEAIDDEVAYWLKKSGCTNITYAPESGSPETLKLIKKKVNLNDMLRSIRHSNKEGMNIKINFIIGFPNETHKNIWESIRFLIQASKAGVHDMAPSIFSPYPGSELFRNLQDSGEIDIYKDDYFIEIVNVDTFFDNKFYNKNIGKIPLRLYLFLYLLVFYSANYFYHPKRFLKTLRNLVTQKYESRGEMALGELLNRNLFRLIRPKNTGKILSSATKE